MVTQSNLYTLKEILVLKMGQKNGSLDFQRLQVLFQLMEKGGGVTLREAFLSQSPGDELSWNQWEREARGLSSWPDHPQQIQRENKTFLSFLQQRRLIDSQKLEPIIHAFRLALSQAPHLRLWEFLLQKKVLSSSHLAQYFGVEKGAPVECKKCNYQIHLDTYFPWREIPCLFCSGSLSKKKDRGALDTALQEEKTTSPEGKVTQVSSSQISRGMGSPSPQSQEYFGKYKILAKLGQGGMGAVYKAYEIDLKRTVALKVITSAGSDDSKYVERFYREVRLAASLQHPHIVPVYEFGEQDGCPYYTMGCIEGTSLREYVNQRKKLSEKEALQILEKVAHAVKYAHQKGIIHRDIKPENIMMDQKGKPHLMDFGLAKKVEGGATRLTKTGAIVGSPEFMAPEQAWGEKGVSYGADIYALGAVLFFMLAGRPPFLGDDTMQLLMQVIKNDPPQLSRLRGGLSREVEIIVGKCLEKKPPDRYTSTLALKKDLQALMSGDFISARPPGVAKQCLKWTKQHKYASLGLVFALGLVMFLGWSVYYAQQVKREAVKEAARKRRLTDKEKSKGLLKKGEAFFVSVHPINEGAGKFCV